jgi:ribosome-associated protein
MIGRDAIARPSDTTDTIKRLESARHFAIEVARLASNTRCHNVAVMEVSGLSPVTDFFVLATGTSARQMRTACDEVQELGENQNFKPFLTSGYEGESWILVDFIDVVFHVFNQESRAYYDLDNLWGDAKKIDWKPSAKS